jgi:hypothetical protein
MFIALVIVLFSSVFLVLFKLITTTKQLLLVYKLPIKCFDHDATFFRSLKNPEDSGKSTGDKLAASEGNDDFDLDRFILEETRRRRRDTSNEDDVPVPDAQGVSLSKTFF